MYRIFDLFAHLEHEMIVSQISLILIRNNIYIFYVTHWMVSDTALDGGDTVMAMYNTTQQQQAQACVPREAGSHNVIP
jgi:hypothetical protein